ncbi:3-hydroxyacyl-CoA dehydrogenase [Edaphobacter sp. DSM 109919]|uniref:3-hydroxyacyl-CoA dehydrogenase n=1 Tax=Edaphobacter paludis TaxID=3035702 RepID=A0AAU7CXC4_9BACT
MNSTIPLSTLYALIIDPGAIVAISSDGSSSRVLLETEKAPDGIYVDPASSTIYFSTMGKWGPDFYAADGTIESCKLDGTDRRLLVGNGETVTPKQLVLDREDGYLYWCDREGMRVMRCRLDGTDVKTLIRAGAPGQQEDATRHCVGLAIDKPNNHLYWTQKGPEDAGRGRIFRAALTPPAGVLPEDRTDIELLFDNLPEPIDLEIDPEESLLYWTDRGAAPDGNSLNRARITPAGCTDHEVIYRGLHEGIGLSLDLASRRAFVTDLGGTVRSIDLDGEHASKQIWHGGPLTGIQFVSVEENPGITLRNATAISNSQLNPSLSLCEA